MEKIDVNLDWQSDEKRSRWIDEELNDKDHVIGKDSHRPRLARWLKKIHVNRWRIESDRKWGIKKDKREFRLARR